MCWRKKRISTLKSYMKQVQNLYRTIFVNRIEKSEFLRKGELYEKDISDRRNNFCK